MIHSRDRRRIKLVRVVAWKEIDTKEVPKVDTGMFVVVCDCTIMVV